MNGKPVTAGFRHIEDTVLGKMLRPSVGYVTFVAVTLVCLGIGGVCYLHQLRVAIGVAGINNPIHWGVYITNFVFWVGIAHSGTLISAILFLFHARWRTSINRIAEAMTLFAIATAGLFPLIHLGRVWLVYYMMPYPNSRGLWINFRSPLIWDVFAITTYMLVSAMFFYVGLIPDLATVRDRSRGILKKAYGLLSLGWRGTHTQWRHQEMAYLLLAALATPLVISVHSVVSWDFAVSLIPGWHSTIFAPYFVAGAIFSGCAMIIVILLPMRKVFGLQELITPNHFGMLGKMLVFMSLIVTYAYFSEFFIAWYSGNIFEQDSFYNRAFGMPYAPLFWLMIAFNSVLPLTLLSRRLREDLVYVYVVAVCVLVGMWLERFVIIVSSLSHDYDPYAWGTYAPTIYEWGITVGSFGLFFLLIALFSRILPIVAMNEVKASSQSKREETGDAGQS
jgi:molybdopterin-containing oxidoreductase family membrane subunit